MYYSVHCIIKTQCTDSVYERAKFRVQAEHYITSYAKLKDPFLQMKLKLLNIYNTYTLGWD